MSERRSSGSLAISALERERKSTSLDTINTPYRLNGAVGDLKAVLW